MVRICFVILHYMALEQTIECVDNIKRIMEKDLFRIIIVDNCSPNDSGHAIVELYLNDSIVDVVLNNANIGFAKGNNIGIEYAREHYNPDFVCCLNNDVLIEDKLFLSKVQDEYNRSKCGVIGPRIYLKDNILFRFEEELKPIEYYREALLQYQSIIGKNEDYVAESAKYGFKNRIINFMVRFKIINIYRGLFHRTFFRKENVILHGCCLVFTPMFFEKLNGFNDRTFLYMEEILLFIMCQRNNILTVYNPKIRVKHLEDCSTKIAWGKKTSVNKAKYMAESLAIVINEMEKMQLQNA